MKMRVGSIVALLFCLLLSVKMGNAMLSATSRKSIKICLKNCGQCQRVYGDYFEVCVGRVNYLFLNQSSPFLLNPLCLPAISSANYTTFIYVHLVECFPVWNLRNLAHIVPFWKDYTAGVDFLVGFVSCCCDIGTDVTKTLLTTFVTILGSNFVSLR